MNEDTIARQTTQLIEKWRTSPALDQAIVSGEDPGWRVAETGPYIALSREAGAGGGHIGRLVAERLGWELLDDKLLDVMAEKYKLPRDMLDFVDETRTNWIHSTFGKLLDRNTVDQMRFVAHLVKVILLAAMHGRVVIVGRGAQFVLPRKSGLAVRIIGPKRARIHRSTERRRLGWDEAEKFVDETDDGRRTFVQRYFHHDIDELHVYDMVLNVEKLGQEGAAQQIVAAWETAFESKQHGSHPTGRP